MTRADYLEILELLSAVESWGFSTKNTISDHLMDRIDSVRQRLRDEILRDDILSGGPL